MKRINKPVLIIIISLLGLFIVFRLGTFRNSNNDFVQILNKILAGNAMTVKTSSKIDRKKISINIASSNKEVFKNGRFLDNIGNVYGGPVFDIYYDSVLIGRALHSNSNDWYVNGFVFYFFSDNNQIKFTFKTNGAKYSGEEGYIWIRKEDDTIHFESFDSNGKLISKWRELQTKD